MDRDKLIELIEKGYEIELKDYPVDNYTEATLNIESLADHLIANGIGDITAEKHRADVAEEALRRLNEISDSNCPAFFGCPPLLNCGSVECREYRIKFFLQQAEAMLKERNNDRD